MEFTNHDLKMFEAAKTEAEKSKYKPFKLGCVISYKGHIIGKGQNSYKSHPLQKKYNRRYRHFNCDRGEFVHDSIHAELSAISSISYTVGKSVDWSKVKIYIYRISPGKRLGFGSARPCPACMAAIKDIGISKVFFTDDDGYGYLELK